MPENCRETVDTAKLIKGILDSYPENTILRELLQNSDDAGATSQIFILDTRTHGVQSLIDPALKATQGPSLIAINNSVFREDDWKALRTLHGSNKTAEQMKTGKFGLGFRACYHVTDNPHILSQRKIVIFDPHEEFSAPFQGGVTLDVLDERSQYLHQLAPFEAVVPDMIFPYQGTVVRLPLRTVSQAGRSRIKPTATLPNDISGYFGKFVENELDATMLFLKHIKSIELREISPEGKMRVVGAASKIDDSNSADGQVHGLSHSLAARDKTFRFHIKTDCSDGTTWRVYDSVQDAVKTAKLMSSRLEYDVGPYLTNDKLFSHVALAIPLDTCPLKGRLFTLLPLPIYPEFPLHIHAIFALTPDRQNLRNKEDTGMSSHSRERLLVEWNYAIFDTFVPSAWAKLLDTLVREDEVRPDIWSAWPCKTEDDLNTSYWGGMSRKLLDAVLSANLPVFPTLFSNSVVPPYVPLNSAIVAGPNEDSAVLAALARAGIALVQPPEYIYRLLKESEFTPMTPVHIHDALMTRVSQIAASSSADKDLILNYLVLTFPADLLNIIGLPLVPLVNDTQRAALRGAETKFVTYVFPSTQEVDLFGKLEEGMIASAAMSPAVQFAFSSQAGQRVNVVPLGVDHVSKYLHSMFGHFNPAVDEIECADATAKVEWLGRFWTWMYTWENANDLMPRVQQFHLLPTTAETFRTVSSRTLLHTGLEPAALSKVGVQFLHPSIPSSMASFMKFGVPSSNIPFVLDLISQDKFSHLDKQTTLQIQAFFIHCLRGSQKRLKLSKDQRAKFIQLPIFSVRRSTEPKFTTPDIGPALGERIFVRDDCPLPIAPNGRTWTYIDVSESSVLAQVIDPHLVIHDELGILENAIPYLECQPPNLLDALVTRITHRISELSKESRDRLMHISFVPVKGIAQRSAPKDIIDPQSEIARLFEGEDGHLPAGSFRDGPFLSVMQSHGFFQRSLTPLIVDGRLRYITKASPRRDSSKFEKANVLLHLLDKLNCWSPHFHEVISRFTSTAWLPTTKNDLRRADKCRDKHEDRHLFDLVLATVDVELTSRGLRQALGWDCGVPIDVLISQFQLTVANPRLSSRVERLMKLIKSLATHSANEKISPVDFTTLKGITSCDRWIPVARNELVATRHAFLSAEINIGGSLRRVVQSLTEGKFGIFLERMGCTERPTLESLLDEATCSTTQLQPGLLILEEIASHHLAQLTDAHRSRLLVPDSRGDFRKVDDVYFNDMHAFTEITHDYGFPTHTTISKSLASKLSLRFLSSLVLGEADEDDEDEDDEDEDIREDLIKRINGVLNDYDIQYALNEFLANAADAGASQFSALLDERSFKNHTVISAQMAEFQRGPALVLFNNGKFTSKDFSGLRRIGEGGKGDASDTIGRFGLGALSLYHFTEVPMVVSGKYVMLLDPSATYLPPRKGRKRTSLKRPLSTFTRKYSDQMSPFESLFGFSLSDSEYNGTLFRLPLRSNATPLSAKPLTGSDCLGLLKEPYFQLARSAFFFTNLMKITAEHRSTGRTLHLWSISVERHAKSFIEETFDRQTISLDLVEPDREPRTEKWLITGSATPLASVPHEFSVVLDKLKLTSSRTGLLVRMALRLYDANRDSKYHLFSCLRLPQTTSLPIHLHSRFCLAPDRRSIRFDPADSTGRRVPQSAYNAWILRNLVPPLYMFSLYDIVASGANEGNNAWWPGGANDDVSREVVNSFYDQLPVSSRPICWTVSHELIPPNKAVFQATETPVIVRILSNLTAPNYVQFGGKIRKHVQGTQLQTADAEFLKSVVQNTRRTFMRLFNHKTILLSDISAMIHFFSDSEKHISLVGLPLLPLADGSLGTLQDPEKPLIYRSSSGKNPWPVFPSTRFIHEKLDTTTIELLVRDSTLNIRVFDSFGVAALIRDRLSASPRCTLTSENADWVDLFWKNWNNLPGPLNSSVLGDLPLVPTCNKFEFVSLNYIEHNSVLPYPHFEPWLAPIAVKLGILMVEKSPTYCIPSFTFDRFLQCIETGQSKFTDLLPGEHEQLAKWVRAQSPSRTFKDTLSRLPVWPARINGSSKLLAADDINMLPLGTSLDILSKYFDPGVAIAEYSPELGTYMMYHLSRPPMGSQKLEQHLRYPSTLLPDQLQDFRSLLDVILSLTDTNTRSTNLRIPNGDLTVVPINRLFDRSIPLFAAALDQTSHVHEYFLDLQLRLRAVGLVHTVTPDVFLLCARRIHNLQDGRDDESPVDANIVDSAEAVYQCCESSELLTQLDQSKWNQFNEIRFIPRQMRRRPGFEQYFAETYCKPLPAIVAPGELVLQDLQSVAWTQRGLFASPPPRILIALNQSIGIPRAEEVVAHLCVLAVAIAPEHPGNNALLRDLRATYEWLNKNSDAARIFLLQHENDRLFLNMDDPSKNMDWKWCSSNELVINLHHDEKGLLGVRNFLLPFNLLLLAAGVTILSDPTFVAINESPCDEPELRAVFNDMRKDGQLTDIVLMPMIVDTNMVMNRLRAHTSFLVAAIPHLRPALLGEWTESRSTEFSFEGSFFGACAVLDFVYTGEILIENFHDGTDGERAMEVLRDLLELLDTAEGWNMQDLKTKIEWLIAEKLRLVSPDTYEMILDHAESRNAKSLVKFCHDFAKDNQFVLRVLTNDEGED